MIGTMLNSADAANNRTVTRRELAIPLDTRQRATKPEETRLGAGQPLGPRPKPPPGNPLVPKRFEVPFELLVAEFGRDASRLASTTCWPAVSPWVISVQVEPIAPTPTWTVFGLPPSRTWTECAVPSVVT